MGALIFTNLVRAASANRAIVAETIVFLFGGILATLHHLYWTGTPTSVIAVGAVFSALSLALYALCLLCRRAAHRLTAGAAPARGR